MTAKRGKEILSAWTASWRTGFGLFGLRGWIVAAIAAVLVVLVLGIPTDMIPNPFFVRMIPVRPQDYFVWFVTALLMGLVGGTFTVGRVKGSAGKTWAGGLLSFLATGCPVCNKLVVLLLGVSGALTYFAPLQLYIGIASIALLVWTLHLRLSALGLSSCVFSGVSAN